MFLEILQTLIKVLLVFSILIIAFGLAFYILLSGVSFLFQLCCTKHLGKAAASLHLGWFQGAHLSFSTVPMSLMRTFAMMLGEIDFLGTYVQPFFRKQSNQSDETTDKDMKTLPYPFPAFFILGIFMVLMPILLMNLLIGLAVGDIESVRRNAQLKRLAMQVPLKDKPSEWKCPSDFDTFSTTDFFFRWFCTPSWRETFPDACWREWTKWSWSNTQTRRNVNWDFLTLFWANGSLTLSPWMMVSPVVWPSILPFVFFSFERKETFTVTRECTLDQGLETLTGDKFNLQKNKNITFFT